MTAMIFVRDGNKLFNTSSWKLHANSHSIALMLRALRPEVRALYLLLIINVIAISIIHFEVLLVADLSAGKPRIIVLVVTSPNTLGPSP